MKWVFSSLEEIAAHFQQSARLRRMNADHGRKNARERQLGEALAYESAAHTLRNTTLTEEYEKAIAIIIDLASRYGENAEETFPRRLQAEMSDAEVKQMLSDGYDEVDVQGALEIRNLWRAIAIIQKGKGEPNVEQT